MPYTRQTANGQTKHTKNKIIICHGGKAIMNTKQTTHANDKHNVTHIRKKTHTHTHIHTNVHTKTNTHTKQLQHKQTPMQRKTHTQLHTKYIRIQPK